MKKVLSAIWNFLIAIGETRAEYIKRNGLYRGY